MPLRCEDVEAWIAGPDSISVQPAAHTRPVGVLLLLGIAVAPIFFAWFLLREGHSTLARVFGFAWLGIVLLAWLGDQDTTHSRPEGAAKAPATQSTQSERVQRNATPARDAQVIEVSAAQLASAYDRNKVAADQSYKGKSIKVTGIVDSITTDRFGSPYIVMRGGVNQFMEPMFKLREQYINYAASLTAGMRITLICTGRGFSISRPMSDNCEPAR
jgi:hypothetical protein